MKLTSFVVPIFVVVILLGCCQASLAQSREANPPHSMKGYELYSWKFRGEWYFSLLVGTNRLKSRKEVTSLKVRVKGVEALKLRLNRLSRGEEVSWSEGLIPRMVLPSDNIIKEVETYCNQHGLILRVSERSASPASNNSFNPTLASEFVIIKLSGFCYLVCSALASGGLDTVLHVKHFLHSVSTPDRTPYQSSTLRRRDE